MKNHITNFFYFSIIIFSCNQNSISKNDHVPKQQRIEYRDSLFVLHTLKTFYKNDWDVFRDDSRFYKIDTSQIQYLISRVFYSPDRKKMIVWVAEKSPNGPSIQNYSSNPKNNYLCPSADNIIYSMNVLICFRNAVSETWKVYPLNNCRVGCANSLQDATNILSQYYFQQMKEHSEYVNKKFLDKNFGGKVRYDLEKNTVDLGYGANSPLILKDYGYNLQDKDFWNKSLIWQKGARIPGLYNFQTNGNVTPDNKDVEIITPKVIYPDTILKMYK